MAIAHELGLNSSATMMFGHVETLDDRIEHLAAAPRAAGRDGWLHGVHLLDVPAGEHGAQSAQTVGAHEYLRMQALARIFLDNFPNVQSSWVTQGPKIGQVALKYGANDFGSVMMEENVVSSAGTSFRLNCERNRTLIREAGYEPRRRNNWYRAAGLRSKKHLPAGEAVPCKGR